MGAQTKRLMTKHPEGQNVRRQNVRRPNICQTKRLAGQNIRWDKTSGRTKRSATKRPAGQDIRQLNFLLQIEFTFKDQ
jgi:hypothetical protein